MELTTINSTTNSTTQNIPEYDLYGDPFLMFLIGGIGVTVSSLIGIFGNILCIIILTRPRMRSSTNIILLGLSVSDLCFVTFAFVSYGLIGLTRYLNVWSAYRNIIFPVTMPFLYPLISAAQVASTFFTVLVTVERFVVVYRPLQARTICTPKNATRASISVVVFAILFTLPTWSGFSSIDKFDENGTWTGYTVEATNVWENPDYKYYFYINWVWLFIIRLLPFFMLAVLNFGIYKMIRKANKRRTVMTQSETNEISIARMLIWVVSIFLICKLCRVYLSIKLALGKEWIAIELVTLSVFFLNLNSALNFIIYCLVGERFRETFAQLFCGGLKDRNFGSSVLTYINSFRMKSETAKNCDNQGNCVKSPSPKSDSDLQGKLTI